MNKIFEQLHYIIRVVLTIIFVVSITLGINNGFDNKIVGVAYNKAIPLVVLVYFVTEFIWLVIDFYRHRKPLLAVDPTVDYSLMHHLRQVTFPTIEYRFNNIFKKNKL